MATRRIASAESSSLGGGQVDADGDDQTDDKHASHKKQGKHDDTWRKFMISPKWKGMMLAVVGITPVSGVFLFLPTGLAHLSCTTFFCQLKHYLLAIYISVMCIYNFAMSQFTDPGGVTDQQKPTFESTGQFQMVFGNEGEGTEEKEYTQIGSSEPLMYAPNYCEHCKHWKPPRTHHCRYCKRCTLRMDHHCPFTGNCIGLKNHGHFVLMYIWAMVGCAYSLVLVCAAIHSNHDQTLRAGRLLQRIPTFARLGFSGIVESSLLRLLRFADLPTGLHLVVTTVASVFVLGCGSAALYEAFIGRTVLEANFPMKEYVQIKHQVYCPLGSGFYRQGWRQNLRDILGPSWLCRLFLPVRGAPPDWHVGVAPRPSPVGVTALLERVEQVKTEGVQSAPRTNEELGINPGPFAGTGKV